MSVRLQALVSVVIFAVIVAKVDVAGSLAELARANTWYAMAAFGLYLLTCVANAAKLRVLLPERTLGQLVGYTLIAQAYALLLPGQLAGEAVKAYRLARRPDTGAGRAASAVAFDKLTAVGGMLLLVLAALVLPPRHFGAGPAWGAAVGVVALFGVAWLLGHMPLERTLTRCFDGGSTGWRTKARGVALRFLETWRTMIHRPRIVLISLGWGVLVQLLSVVATWLLGHGLGIELPLAAWCIVIGGLSVVLLAPITLGGLGLREASLVGLLGLFGVDPQTALALALAILAIQLAIGAAGVLVDLAGLAKRDEIS